MTMKSINSSGPRDLPGIPKIMKLQHKKMHNYIIQNYYQTLQQS